MGDYKKASAIQRKIDDQFGLDISLFQSSEVKRLAEWLKEFLDCGVETDDLEPAEDDLESEDE